MGLDKGLTQVAGNTGLRFIFGNRDAVISYLEASSEVKFYRTDVSIFQGRIFRNMIYIYIYTHIYDIEICQEEKYSSACLC